MSSDITDKPFDSAGKQVEAAYEEAVDNAKSKVDKAKAAALKKVTV